MHRTIRLTVVNVCIFYMTTAIIVLLLTSNPYVWTIGYTASVLGILAATD